MTKEPGPKTRGEAIMVSQKQVYVCYVAIEAIHGVKTGGVDSWLAQRPTDVVGLIL